MIRISSKRQLLKHREARDLDWVVSRPAALEDRSHRWIRNPSIVIIIIIIIIHISVVIINISIFIIVIIITTTIVLIRTGVADG